MRELIIILFLFFVSVVQAKVKLPSIISDHIILQQKSKVPLWGWANPGENILIKTSWGKIARVITPASGRWMVKINTPKAGGPFSISIKGDNLIELKDVLIGEVWVCSGQSNMAFKLKDCLNARQEIEGANFTQIRLFKAASNSSSEPQNDCEGKWSLCTSVNAEAFSAVAYFFGKELYDKLKIPVGLIQTAWGGSNAEAWMSHEALVNNTLFKPILERFAKVKTDYERSKADWEQQSKANNINGAPKFKPNQAPSYLYNGMLHPFIPFGIKGVIWYQGENNASNRRSYQYRQLFPSLIKNWRNDWKQGDFPFYFVQIAPFHYHNPDGSSLAELREAQMMTLRVKNTGMAVTLDIGDTLSIHPKNKKEVGKRLALWAFAKDYGQKGIVYSGPIYRSMKTKDGSIVLTFKYAGGGYISRGEVLKTFTIAGIDKKFIKAEAIIKGNKVVVKSPYVKNPVAVRYAWRNSDVPNLFNREGLPASSFRTDDWPGETFYNK